MDGSRSIRKFLRSIGMQRNSDAWLVADREKSIAIMKRHANEEAVGIWLLVGHVPCVVRKFLEHEVGSGGGDLKACGSRYCAERVVRNNASHEDFWVSYFIAGRMRAVTAKAGLSLGDRFCLAQAKPEDLTAWTADTAWTAIADVTGIKIFSIR